MAHSASPSFKRASTLPETAFDPLDRGTVPQEQSEPAETPSTPPIASRLVPVLIPGVDARRAPSASEFTDIWLSDQARMSKLPLSSPEGPGACQSSTHAGQAEPPTGHSSKTQSPVNLSSLASGRLLQPHNGSQKHSIQSPLLTAPPNSRTLPEVNSLPSLDGKDLGGYLKALDPTQMYAMQTLTHIPNAATVRASRVTLSGSDRHGSTAYSASCGKFAGHRSLIIKHRPNQRRLASGWDAHQGPPRQVAHNCQSSFTHD